MMPLTYDIWNDKRIYYAMGFLALCGLTAASWYGYSLYLRSKEKAAYKDLAESIESYSKSRSTVITPEKWVDIERAFDVGAQRHASSKLHPYFLAYQADVLVEQGKQKEAVALMDRALSEITKSQPLYYLYAIKRALLKTDTDDAALQKQGRDELQALAHDGANPVQDMALYYTGLDARSRGETGFEKFFEEIISHGNQSSYWHQMAQYSLRSGT